MAPRSARPQVAGQLRRPTALAFAGGVLAAVLLSVASAGAEAPNLCVAANGEVRTQHGTATCTAEGQGSVARAMGADSSATAAFGDHNRATASGHGSDAVAEFGNNNTATASGDGSIAVAAVGDNNTATAATDGCGAFANGGKPNRLLLSPAATPTSRPRRPTDARRGRRGRRTSGTRWCWSAADSQRFGAGL